MLYSQGKYEQAEKLYLETLDGFRHALGDDNYTTLVAMNNCAIVFWRQHKYQDCLNMYLDLLKIQKVKLGQDHADTITTMNKLAKLYFSEGKYDEAEVIECRGKYNLN